MEGVDRSGCRGVEGKMGSLHESALSVRHLGRRMNGLRAGRSAAPLMAAAREAAGVTSLTCQKRKLRSDARATTSPILCSVSDEACVTIKNGRCAGLGPTYSQPVSPAPRGGTFAYLDSR